MENFNWVDGAVIAVIAISAILAYSRGLVREIFSIGGWIVAAVCGFQFAPAVEPLVHEIPYVGDFAGTRCGDIAIGAAFAVTFAVALILVSIFTSLISGMVQNSVLDPIDRGLGLLFGIARGAILVAIGFVLFNTLVGASDWGAEATESRSQAAFSGLEERLVDMLPENAQDWIGDRFESLKTTCSRQTA